MTLHPRLSRPGVELVKRFEGLRRKAARTPDGRWTIGYGHTASAREGAEVTPEDAEALLLYDLNRVAQRIDELVLTPVNVNQFAALTAFAFNVGVDSFERSNVLRRINEGAYLQAAAALEMWRKAEFHGEPIVVDALVRRRAAEKIIFLTPPEGFRPVPSAVVRPQYDGAPELQQAETGLADAADLRVEMQGDAATAERHVPAPLFDPPPAESATAVAARNVAERLNSLFSDDPPPPPPIQAPPVEDLAAPPFPQAVPEPVPEPEPEPVAADPEREPAPQPEREPEPSLFSAPPPLAYEPPPRRFPEPEPALEAVEEEAAGGPFGRRYPTLGERAAAVHAPEPVEPPNNLAILALGVFGAALFCGALATMVFGRATLVNLALGLLGVVCMVPSGVRLLGQLFAERPEEETDDEA